MLCALLRHPAISSIVQRHLLELGSGTGLAGLFAAKGGAHILLTDVPSLTPLLWRNIRANSHEGPSVAAAHTSADRLQPLGFQGACSVGAAGGSAAACALDWTQGCAAQLAQHKQQLQQLHAVIACEVLWLQELVEPYCRTLAWLLAPPQRPRCFMSFTARGTEQSKTFASRSQVLACLARHGCAVQEVPELAAQTADGEAVEAWILQKHANRQAASAAP